MSCRAQSARFARRRRGSEQNQDKDNMTNQSINKSLTAKAVSILLAVVYFWVAWSVTVQLKNDETDTGLLVGLGLAAIPMICGCLVIKASFWPWRSQMANVISWVVGLILVLMLAAVYIAAMLVHN